MASYVTTTPRSSSDFSMYRALNLNRKYHRTAQLMTAEGGDRDEAVSLSSPPHFKAFTAEI